MESDAALVAAGNNHLQHPAAPAAGMVHTTSIGGASLERRAELATAAVAAAAKAETEARYAIALARPRDMNMVLVRLLAECKRPGFCLAARYAKPIGRELNEDTGKWENKFAEGFSIRFAEVALRCFGNLQLSTSILHDDERTRLMQVTVTDLEANVTASAPVYVAKVIERKKLKTGQHAISRRLNSYGKEVFLLEATEDEMLVKAAALGAKVRRNLILGMIPGDILDDCRQHIEATLSDPNAVDPKAQLKKLLEAFADIAILPTDLAKYLDHEIEKTTPQELADLRGIWVALRDGETTWKEVLATREIVDAETVPATSPPAAAAAPPSGPAKTTADLKEREKARRQAKAPAQPAPAASTPAAAAPAAPVASAPPALTVRGHEGKVVARGTTAPELPWGSEPVPGEREPGSDDE